MLSFVDAHQHFQDLSNHYYPWLADQDRPPQLEGNLDPIRRNYLPPDYAEDIASADVRKTVHVQNGWDPSDPVGETRWLQALAERSGQPTAIVAYADLHPRRRPCLQRATLQGDLMRQVNLRFATRLNSFGSKSDAFWPKGHGKPTPLQLAERASKVAGLTDVDLNYPDHLGPEPRATGNAIRELGLAVNGLAMRYYSNPAFKIGAFTNPDPAVRREAIDLTKRGIDAAREAGCNLMTLWLGQDGFDYAFQADYGRLWAEEIEGIREVALHDPDCLISIEYKPNEPRSYSLMPDCATTLLALKEVALPNLGVTLDFAHVLYADEQPAFAAALIARHSRVLGVHLNDGYAKRDDGLMVGAVHPLQTIELLRQVKADGFDGPLYFDTFPDLTGLDPIKECETNISTVKAMLRIIDRLDGENELFAAIALQDAVAANAIVQRAMFGG